jgi:hypothetical protein
VSTANLSFQCLSSSTQGLLPCRRVDVLPLSLLSFFTKPLGVLGIRHLSRLLRFPL